VCIAATSEVPSLKLTQLQEGEIEMEDHDIRAALDRHWAASDANDFEAEHQIYRDDAVLEYPQSGERIRGRRNIQASRFAQPNRKRFTVRRILGTADLWITELVIAYDGLTRQRLPILDRSTLAPASGVAKGAYVLGDCATGSPTVILIATGSEVSLALEAHNQLAQVLPAPSCA
jgi:hypothetical protein